ncbi:hypothetical protein VTL71DRAFT_10538 [Oculimacula yallundae]|uniref:Tyrosine phosphatase n=1 Tax=Oculimacula yallundae TaxID=86028 RepID=A0ABR4CTJ3_9HELO
MGPTEMKMSRRSTRTFTEEHEVLNKSNMPLPSSSSDSSLDGNEPGQHYGIKGATAGIEMMRPPVVNLGRSLDIFPSTLEDVRMHINESIKAAKASTNEKQNGRPSNFGVVLPGKIYRSSWPKNDDFAYLSSLRLKTVLSLVKNDFEPEFKDFLKLNQIEHKVIDMPGTKKVGITPELMQSIMEIVLDEANHPILIHCNHGKHRTGCAVGVIRHVARWGVEAIIEEYRGYAEPKIRDCDLKYITGFNVMSLQNLFTKPDTPRSSNSRINNRDRKILKFFVVVATVMTIWFTSIWNHWIFRL